MGLFIVMAQLAPVVLFPIFYKFEPLDNEDLRRRSCGAERSVPGRGCGASTAGRFRKKAKKANAALTGLGATRRIILAGTPCSTNYSPEEIEAVLAHELGHHVHRHILKSIFSCRRGLRSSASRRQIGPCITPSTSICLRNCLTFANLPLLSLVSGRALLCADASAQRVFALQRSGRADRYAFESIAKRVS